MNKELELYSNNYNKKQEGGKKSIKYESDDEKSDISIIRKYRKKCLELKKENDNLKNEIKKLKKDLENKNI